MLFSHFVFPELLPLGDTASDQLTRSFPATRLLASSIIEL
jgi:hypothetical protein